MRKLVYSVDTLAMVHAVVSGLESLGLPADAVQFTAPQKPTRDDLPEQATRPIDADDFPAAPGDVRQPVRYVLASADSHDLSSPAHAELSQGRCILGISVPEEQLPHVEILFAAFRDDVHRIDLAPVPFAETA